MNEEQPKENKTPFEKLNGINVNDNTEKKGKFSYLSWTWAWAELQKVYPLATYEVVKFDGLPYKENSRNECMVFTKLTVDNITHEMWLPVMDSYNKALKNPDMMAINKALMRCLVKNIAMFGLGLYIYAGEDLPDSDDGEVQKKAEVIEQGSITQKQPIKTKEEAKAVVEKIQMDFEKIKSKIVDSENIQDFESAKSEANKFLTQMNDLQKSEIRNIVQNKKSILNNSNENTITPTNIGA